MITELEVLNHMLNVVGESPVSTISSDHPTVLSAMTQLRRMRKELQLRAWWFNTEYDLRLIPNELGQIIIPSNTMFVDPVDPWSHLVRRSGKLYDPKRHTYIINQPISVNVVLELNVEDMPDSAAAYLMHKCAYDFYVNDDGDETKSNRLKMEVDRTWAVLQQESLRAADTNAKLRPQVANLRHGMRQQGSSYNPRWPGGKR